MAFTEYDGIQQTSVNSCGAFALAAGMTNFGVELLDQNAHLLNTADLAQGFDQAVSAISCQGGAAAFGDSIYQVTGNLLLDLTAPSATYRYEAPVADMNSPSTIAYVAVLFGFAPVVYYDNTGQGTFTAVPVTNLTGQGNLFDTEVAIMATQGGITVTGSPDGYTNLPAADQVHLLLVNNDHWVAINDTQIYDPATGFVGAYTVNDPLPLATISYMYEGVINDYGFSGIWIQLQWQQ